MPHPDAPAICGRIDAALDYIGATGDELRHYLIYQIDEIMAGPKHIDPEDCTTPELMALLAVLAPVFARQLTGTTAAAPPAKLLTLILGDGGVCDGTSGA